VHEPLDTDVLVAAVGGAFPSTEVLTTKASSKWFTCTAPTSVVRSMTSAGPSGRRRLPSPMAIVIADG
ncbi:MAG: hypothetical protein AAFW98_09970, partial [Pseudomonadota bacterium]